MNLNDSVVRVFCWSYLLQLLIFAITAMHPANSFAEKKKISITDMLSFFHQLSKQMLKLSGSRERPPESAEVNAPPASSNDFLRYLVWG